LERFFISLGNARTPDDAVTLWQQGGALRPELETLALKDAAHRLGTRRRAIVAVPSETVILVPLTLPVRGRRQRVQALPYALEELLLDDIEHLAFQLAEGTEEDGHFAAAVCRRQRLEDWHALLQECGLGVEALMPDALLLPWRPGTWTLGRDGSERILVRHGRALGGAVHPRLLSFYLERLGDAARERGCFPSSLVSYGVERPEGFTETAWDLRSEVWFTEPDPNPPRLNLLADLTATKSRAQRRWRPWRLSAALAAAWLLVLWIHLGLDVLRLHHERQSLDKRISLLFHQTFPQDRRIVDVRVQMARGLSRLERRSSTGRWVQLLAAAAVARPPELRFTTAVYRNGRLELTVEDRASQDIVRFLHALERAHDVRAKAVGLSTTGGITRARVVLEERDG
jgi:general secretion pathway protein L